MAVRTYYRCFSTKEDLVYAVVNNSIEGLKEEFIEVMQMPSYLQATGIRKLEIVLRQLLNKAWKECAFFVCIDEIQLFFIRNDAEPIRKAYAKGVQTVTEVTLKAIDARIQDGTVHFEIRECANFAAFSISFRGFFTRLAIETMNQGLPDGYLHEELINTYINSIIQKYKSSDK